MRPVSHTFVDSVRAPVVQVFALLTDPGRIPKWLPGCDSVESGGPFKKGVRFKARFGDRTSEFEIVDFSPPATFGWTERGQRKGTKLFLRLDVTGTTTAVTIREISTPRGFIGWVRGRFFERRHVQQRLQTIVQNVRALLAT
jgi:uncharacterized protein YndB with AHSA1/START domain